MPTDIDQTTALAKKTTHLQLVHVSSFLIVNL